MVRLYGEGRYQLKEIQYDNNTHPGLQNRPIYLDYNATTPVDPLVAEAMLPYLAMHFGNPSSTHSYGQEAHRAVKEAREQVAHLLGAEPVRLYSRAAAQKAIIWQFAASRWQSDIKATISSHRLLSIRLSTIRVGRLNDCMACALPIFRSISMGASTLADVEEAIDDQTVLISIMHANNETGTLQPISRDSRNCSSPRRAAAQ